ncbi:MAG: VOC family protein [Novosphingobium sp.]|nr:VOC family protein [Novosphingobium sp.]
MGNPAGSFIWYELMTTDPDAAQDFYGKVVGWQIVGTPEPDAAVDYRHIIRSDGSSNGGVLKLTDDMCAGGARPCWMGYLYVEDVDAAVDVIVADGGKMLLPAFDLEVGRIAMMADPQGVPIYIMTPIPPAGVEDPTSDVYDRFEVQHVSWNELYSPDIDGAKAFYSRHFNFEFNESMPMGEMGDYCFIDHGGQTIGAMMQKPPQLPMGLWNYYIRVADLDKAVEAVKAGGGQVLNGPMEVPGGDRIINGMDPQGAPFSLVAAGTE